MRSIISSEQAVGLSLSRRLFVPTWMMSWSGFFLLTGLIWSRISLVVQPREVETLTLLLSLDILWAFECFSTESLVIMVKQAGLSSRSPSSALPLSVVVSSVFSRAWNLLWCAMVPLFKFSFTFRFDLFYGINVQLHSLNFLEGQLPRGSDYPAIDIFLHSFLATALRGFNDLGHSVTPTFLSRSRFYLQWSIHCPKMNKNWAWEVKKKIKISVHGTSNPAILWL